MESAGMPDTPIVIQLPIILRPDPMRTVIRPFLPTDPGDYTIAGPPGGERIIARIRSLDETELHLELERIRLSLDERHRDVLKLLHRRFDEIAEIVPDAAPRHSSSAC